MQFIITNFNHDIKYDVEKINTVSGQVLFQYMGNPPAETLTLSVTIACEKGIMPIVIRRSLIKTFYAVFQGKILQDIKKTSPSAFISTVSGSAPMVPKFVCGLLYAHSLDEERLKKEAIDRARRH